MIRLVIIALTVFFLPLAEVMDERMAIVLGVAVLTLAFFQRKNFKVIALILITISLINAQWGLAQFIAQEDFHLQTIGESDIGSLIAGVAKFGEDKLIRAYGYYSHANVYAGVLAIGSVLTVRLFRKRKDRLGLVFLGILFLGEMVAFSRSGIIATLVSFLLIRDKKETRSKFLLMVGIITIIFLPFWTERLSDKNDNSNLERVSGIKWSVELIKDHPLFGIGIKGYKAALDEYLGGVNESYDEWQIDYVHSVPFLITAKVGLAGVTLLIFAVILFIKRWYYRDNLVYLLVLVPLIMFDHYLATQASPLLFAAMFIMINGRLTD